MMKLEKHEERNHAKTVVSPVLSDIPAAVEAIAQSEETENRQEESGVLKKYEKSNLSDEQKERLLSAILTLMENEKPYLDPDLTLDVVSQKLNVYKKYISQVINEKLGKNFITFINEYRVRDSKKMLIDKKFHNYTIEGIANTSGFHSKTSFNTAFKKFTGITPSFFREEALKSNNTLREK
jgi:YesN/AraC family two-component response regulator